MRCQCQRDRHLFDLERYEGIEIVTLTVFWKRRNGGKAIILTTGHILSQGYVRMA